MMDYRECAQAESAYLGKATYGDQAVSSPCLHRIGDLASEAEQAAGFIQDFIARCRGGATVVSGQPSVAPVPSGHFGQIDRLSSAVMELSKLARELGSIG